MFYQRKWIVTPMAVIKINELEMSKGQSNRKKRSPMLVEKTISVKTLTLSVNPCQSGFGIDIFYCKPQFQVKQCSSTASSSWPTAISRFDGDDLRLFAVCWLVEKPGDGFLIPIFRWTCARRSDARIPLKRPWHAVQVRTTSDGNGGGMDSFLWRS